MCCLPLSKHARGITMHTVSENKHSVHLGKHPSVSHVSDVRHRFVNQSGSLIWNELWGMAVGIKVLSSRSECLQRENLRGWKSVTVNVGDQSETSLFVLVGGRARSLFWLFLTVTGDGRVVRLVSNKGKRCVHLEKMIKYQRNRPRQFCETSVSQGVGVLWLRDLMAGRAGTIVGLLTFMMCATWVSGDSAVLLGAFTLSFAVKLKHSATFPEKRL